MKDFDSQDARLDVHVSTFGARACAHACVCIRAPSVAHLDERLNCPNLLYFIDRIVISKYLFTSSKKQNFESHKNRLVSEK